MRLRGACLVALALLLPNAATAQTRRALLIGINTYQPPGTKPEHPAGCVYGRCELGAFENLKGSVNDAESMADLLTSPKFGFPAANVALLTNPASQHARPGVVTLPADQTTHDGILAAMKKYLVDLPNAGDTVVFYDASHGSLRINSKGTKLSVVVNGELQHADSTLVPSDAYLGGYDVRDREMTRIFNAALDKGVYLVIIFDSCHSGGSTRSLSEYRPRALAFDPRDIAEVPDKDPAPTERGQNPALVFAAVQQDQSANESRAEGGEEHGAFTAALVEALETLPADAPASLVYRRVRAALEGSGVPNQEPDLDATEARRAQPLFGPADKASDTKELRTAALQTTSSGDVWLDAGRVSGIGVGTVFTSWGKTPAVDLRVKSLEGMSRSIAEIVVPQGATVKPGEVFKLKHWVPDQKPLLLWHAPANLSQAEVMKAAQEVAAAGVAFVSDPAEQAWTDRLTWNGTSWTLTHAPQPPAAGPVALDAKTPAPVMLGSPLAAAKLKASLAPGAKLWVDLPPPRELAAQLQLHVEASAVQGTDDIAQASYVLAGTLTAKGPAYAWFHKTEYESGPPQGVTRHTAGCSTTSPYPVRSAWVALQHGAMADDPSGGLNLYALRLAKVDRWLQLGDAPGAAFADSYYKLTLSREKDGEPIPADRPAKDGDTLYMSLVSDSRVVSQRWVYVLDIDCQGNGSLLYPIDYAENRFPNTAGSQRRVPLTGARKIEVGEPYGMDTIVMLSTEQPLPDPEALNFSGVGASEHTGTRSLNGTGPPTPLSQLLGDASTGKRGVHARESVPTSWSLDMTPLLSEPPQ
jgi:hypothetical protein